jgi:TonB family protein
LLLLSVVTFIAGFWCACAVKGTVRAALLTFPLIALMRLIVEAGIRLGAAGPIGAFNNFMLSTIHPYAYSASIVGSRDHQFFSAGFYRAEFVIPIVLTAVMCAAAIAGSLAQFRRDSCGEETPVLRRALPLLILALFTGILSFTLRDLSFRPYLQQLMVLDEVHRAAGRLGIDAAALDESRPVTITVSQLAASAPLSALTAKWLRNASLSIHPTEVTIRGQMPLRVSAYYVSILFSTGRECRTAGFYWVCREANATVPASHVPTMIVPANLAQARAVSQVKPVVPPGVAGDRKAVVRLRVSIDENGNVSWVQPLAPADEPFLSAAVEAVKQWRYQPSRWLGWPQNAVTEVTVTFP